MGPWLFFLLGVPAFARGGQFSQRLEAPIAAYGWTPLVPVSTRTQNGRVYTTQDGAPQVYRQGSGASVDTSRQLSSPQSRTVTASITWPPEQPGQQQPAVPPRDEVVGGPEEDVAVPETDPPTFDGRPENRVVETTLKTPVSHGYVVALVKKPNQLKSYFKSKVPGAVRDDQPAFFVYVPPSRRGTAAAFQGPPQMGNGGGQRATGVPRYVFFRQPFPERTVLIYVPQEGQLSAPLLVPVNPSLNALLEHPKPKALVDSAAALNAPWFAQSLEAPAEDIIKLTLSQLGRFHA
ncbi:hypothetical protein HPB50_008552 [Hyalomma asiaticum]|uniref:Uncharacterized protein n=1 Tax=Hyalomma asiaticum TaxID=266040 RepID=A0ACB7RV32_HYAAI|nr:hypothetical protein HPB50_008552 [Hyalomma asiaticum]